MSSRFLAPGMLLYSLHAADGTPVTGSAFKQHTSNVIEYRGCFVSAAGSWLSHHEGDDFGEYHDLA